MIREMLVRNSDTRSIADFPRILCDLVYFYCRQTRFCHENRNDVVGCYIYSHVGWYLKGLLSELVGGRNNYQLLYEHKGAGKVKDFRSHFVFVTYQFAI